MNPYFFTENTRVFHIGQVGLVCDSKGRTKLMLPNEGLIRLISAILTVALFSKDFRAGSRLPRRESPVFFTENRRVFRSAGEVAEVGLVSDSKRWPGWAGVAGEAGDDLPKQ